MRDKTIKTRFNGTKELFKDEVYIEMASALGQRLIIGHMPKKMEEGLKKIYLDSGAVKSSYLYVDGKEITDGINYNPFGGVLNVQS